MAHPPELIQRVTSIIERDYPPTLYRYQFERAIPGSRMMPDILVCDQTGQRMLCAVEIGYTRPEKLTAYRGRFGIPDVRWYDKQGQLHADVKEISVKVSAEPAGTLYAYGLMDRISCDHCLEKWIADEKERLSEPDAEIWDEDFETRFFEDSFDDVLTVLVTDYVKAWFACLCDKCGGHWFANSDQAEVVLYDLKADDAREFASIYGGRSAPLGWRECIELIERRLDLVLRYEDGVFIDPGHNREWSHSRLQIRREAKGR